jgi:hypothetical protein
MYARPLRDSSAWVLKIASDRDSKNVKFCSSGSYNTGSIRTVPLTYIRLTCRYMVISQSLDISVSPTTRNWHETPSIRADKGIPHVTLTLRL